MEIEAAFEVAYVFIHTVDTVHIKYNHNNSRTTSNIFKQNFNPEDGGSKLLHSDSDHVQDYRLSSPRRPQFNFHHD
jgi:hypothetical protein